jgi:hypothetical protein
MTVTARELLLLGLLLAQFTGTGAAHADPICSTAPPAELVVEMSYAEPQFSAEKSVTELRIVAEAWGIPARERQAHPLLVVSSNVDGGAVVVEESATQVDFRAEQFCLLSGVLLTRQRSSSDLSGAVSARAKEFWCSFRNSEKSNYPSRSHYRR